MGGGGGGEDVIYIDGSMRNIYISYVQYNELAIIGLT